MGAGSGNWRNRLPEENLLRRIDRGREMGNRPKQGAFDDVAKKRLHDCKPGDYVRQVLSGKDNYGPFLRVVDPQSGIVENREGRKNQLPPRTQVVVQL